MTPGDVARIVEHRSDGTFIGLLREADAEFEDQSFEPSLAVALRAEPLHSSNVRMAVQARGACLRRVN